MMCDIKPHLQLKLNMLCLIRQQ